MSHCWLIQTDFLQFTHLVQQWPGFSLFFQDQLATTGYHVPYRTMLQFFWCLDRLQSKVVRCLQMPSNFLWKYMRRERCDCEKKKNNDSRIIRENSTTPNSRKDLLWVWLLLGLLYEYLPVTVEKFIPDDFLLTFLFLGYQSDTFQKYLSVI